MRIPLLLDARTAAALLALAKQEYRDPRAQALLIIRQELERRGLLQIATPEDHVQTKQGGSDADQ